MNTATLAQPFLATLPPAGIPGIGDIITDPEVFEAAARELYRNQPRRETLKTKEQSKGLQSDFSPVRRSKVEKEWVGIRVEHPRRGAGVVWSLAPGKGMLWLYWETTGEFTSEYRETVTGWTRNGSDALARLVTAPVAPEPMPEPEAMPAPEVPESEEVRAERATRRRRPSRVLPRHRDARRFIPSPKARTAHAVAIARRP